MKRTNVKDLGHVRAVLKIDYGRERQPVQLKWRETVTIPVNATVVGKSHPTVYFVEIEERRLTSGKTWARADIIKVIEDGAIKFTDLMSELHPWPQIKIGNTFVGFYQRVEGNPNAEPVVILLEQIRGNY